MSNNNDKRQLTNKDIEVGDHLSIPSGDYTYLAHVIEQPLYTYIRVEIFDRMDEFGSLDVSSPWKQTTPYRYNLVLNLFPGITKYNPDRRTELSKLINKIYEEEKKKYAR